MEAKTAAENLLMAARHIEAAQFCLKGGIDDPMFALHMQRALQMLRGTLEGVAAAQRNSALLTTARDSASDRRTPVYLDL